MKQYNIPSEIISSDDAVIKHGDALIKYGDRALIITSKNAAVVSGALGDIISALTNNGQSFKIFDKITENPKTSIAKKAGEIAKIQKVNFIIAIGGGSVIDGAKAAAVFASNDINENELYLCNWSNKPLPLCFIGTTAGTGSEVTSISVLTSDNTNKKRSFSHPDLYSKITFCDYKYTKTMSSDTTLSTALDALSHSLEGFFSLNCDKNTDKYSIESIILLTKQLSRFEKNNNIYNSDSFRMAVFKASILSGITLNSCKTCFPHLCGYILTENFNIPHGFSCAYFLCDFLKICKNENNPKIEILESIKDIKTDNIIAMIEKLISPYFKNHKIYLTKSILNEEKERFENSQNLKQSPGNLNADSLIELMLKKSNENL